MINIMVNLFYCIISSIIVFDFMEKFFERKFNISISIPFTILTFMQFFANSFGYVFINFLSTFIYFLIISILLYESEKYNIFVVTFILMVFLIGIENLILTVILLFFSHYMDYASHYPIRVILSLVFTLIGYYFVIMLFSKKRIYINKYEIMDIIVIIFCLIVTILIVYLVGFDLTTREIITYIIIATVILLVCIYVIFVIDIKSRNQELIFNNEMRNEKLKIYHNSYRIKLLDIEKKESFYHDLKNHLQVLYHLYNNGDIEKANKYFEKLVGKIPVPTKIISNDILQIMINDLKLNCENENIELSLSINNTISFSQLDEIDLVIIFSNLFSNAVESAKKCYSDKKSISLYINIKNNFIIIRITNSFNHELNRDGNKFYTSKINHKGFGIKNIINKIEKYNGTFSILTNHNIFEFQIILPIQK